MALTLALTTSGVGSIIGWAIRLTLSQFAAAGALLIRALPVVLLSVLVFFNTYVWIMSATISQPRLWLALGLLVAYRRRLRHIRHVRKGRSAIGIGDGLGPARRATRTPRSSTCPIRMRRTRSPKVNGST